MTTTVLMSLLACYLLPHFAVDARSPTSARRPGGNVNDVYIHCRISDNQIQQYTSHRLFFSSQQVSKSARPHNYGHMAVVNSGCVNRPEREKPVDKSELEQGKNVMQACQSGEKPPTNVLIGYFDKGKHGLQHSGIFRGCEQTGFKMADQFQGKKFGVRDIEYDDRCKRRENCHFCGKNFYFLSLKKHV